MIDIPLCCCSSISRFVMRNAKPEAEVVEVAGLLKYGPHIIHCEGGNCEER